MRFAMVIDLSKCCRCHACVVACRVEHFLPLHVMWVKLIAHETEESGVVDVTTIPVRCNQCANASCVDVCPTGASQRRADGIVHVITEKCIGCGRCVAACPYQSRTLLSEALDPGYFPGHAKSRFETKREVLYPHKRATTMKCNFCLERIDQGLAHNLVPGTDRDATPACVNACQARALTFGNVEDADSAIARLLREREAKPLRHELGTEPSVFYIDGKIGGKPNVAPRDRQTGSHMKWASSMEARAKEIFAGQESGGKTCMQGKP